MKPLPLTGSSASLISRCISAGAFGWPRGDEEGVGDRSDIGNAGHEHLFHRAIVGVDEAMARLPATCEKWGLSEKDADILTARLRKFAWSPPRGALSEVALMLFNDRACVEHGADCTKVTCTTKPNLVVQRVRGGRGKYPELPNRIIAAQIDLMWSEPEPLIVDTDGEGARLVVCPTGSVLHVVDAKFGSDAWVAPPNRNTQLLTEGVLAALWTGAEQVAPMILYPNGEHGQWDAPSHLWGKREIEDGAAKLVDLKAWRERAIERLAAGGTPEVSPGPWCITCPSFTACPAQLSLVRSALPEEGMELVVPVRPLTAERRVALLNVTRALKRAVEQAEAVLRADVNEQGAIDLGDGGVRWGKVQRPVKTIDVALAAPVLAEELGDFAPLALETSMAKIEDAVRTMHDAQGVKRKRAPTMRRIIARMHDAHAIGETTREEYRIHRVTEPEPEPEPDILERLLRESVDER